MACKYCGEKDQSKLMIKSEVVNCRVEKINICLNCWWFKEINTDGKNGNLLPEKESIKRRISKKPESSYSGMGKTIS